ncbi:hypothetical protein H696_03595 [Fonticula alba]|uniref:PNPLA domain-containing protein n=1 Tax=Fonticula alba TaxID=691883 RepID=A0A058Z770_FONAL|nr:hypothetical protein H696_03595 [Fonticula alba]KCV70134.1 hypothetical protein H696_03595 [Fonticula alba]|eukprot:XP_009495740.1 hypothetical protein H696_03595 [Fonticula alba]
MSGQPGAAHDESASQPLTPPDLGDVSPSLLGFDPAAFTLDTALPPPGAGFFPPTMFLPPAAAAAALMPLPPSWDDTLRAYSQTGSGIGASPNTGAGHSNSSNSNSNSTPRSTVPASTDAGTSSGTGAAPLSPGLRQSWLPAHGAGLAQALDCLANPHFSQGFSASSSSGDSASLAPGAVGLPPHGNSPGSSASSMALSGSILFDSAASSISSSPGTTRTASAPVPTLTPMADSGTLPPELNVDRSPRPSGRHPSSRSSSSFSSGPEHGHGLGRASTPAPSRTGSLLGPLAGLDFVEGIPPSPSSGSSAFLPSGFPLFRGPGMMGQVPGGGPLSDVPFHGTSHLDLLGSMPGPFAGMNAGVPSAGPPGAHGLSLSDASFSDIFDLSSVAPSGFLIEDPAARGGPQRSAFRRRMGHLFEAGAMVLSLVYVGFYVLCQIFINYLMPDRLTRAALKKELALARTYPEWRRVALSLDCLDGYSAWRIAPRPPAALGGGDPCAGDSQHPADPIEEPEEEEYFDAPALRAHVKRLRCAQDIALRNGDYVALRYLVRALMIRNLGGTADRRLYTGWVSGSTKALIEIFVSQLAEAIQVLSLPHIPRLTLLAPEHQAALAPTRSAAEAPGYPGLPMIGSGLSATERRTALRHAQQSLGRTCLALCGGIGSARGAQHLGVVKALFEMSPLRLRNSVIPRRGAGASGPSTARPNVATPSQETSPLLESLVLSPPAAGQSTAQLRLPSPGARGTSPAPDPFERGILPTIFYGTDVGAIVAAFVCVRTDAELREFFTTGDQTLDFSIFYQHNTPSDTGDAPVEGFSSSSASLRRRFDRFIQHGVFFDAAVLRRFVRAKLRVSFQQAPMVAGASVHGGSPPASSFTTHMVANLLSGSSQYQSVRCGCTIRSLDTEEASHATEARNCPHPDPLTRVCPQAWIEDITFMEAFERSGRVLNIRVTDGLVLNYLTAPNAIIWSAACAACATPGLISPTPVLARTADGEHIPWLPSSGRPGGTTISPESLLSTMPLAGTSAGGTSAQAGGAATQAGASGTPVSRRGRSSSTSATAPTGPAPAGGSLSDSSSGNLLASAAPPRSIPLAPSSPPAPSPSSLEYQDPLLRSGFTNTDGTLSWSWLASLFAAATPTPAPLPGGPTLPLDSDFGDLPSTRLSELFNVNHFIVSQMSVVFEPIAPSVTPPPPVRSIAPNSWSLPARAVARLLRFSRRFRYSVGSFVRRETQYRLSQLFSLGLLPAGLASLKGHLAVHERGHIVIYPLPSSSGSGDQPASASAPANNRAKGTDAGRARAGGRASSAASSSSAGGPTSSSAGTGPARKRTLFQRGARALSSTPTGGTRLRQGIHRGERATWPHLPRARVQLTVERILEEALMRIDQEISWNAAAGLAAED